MDEQRPSTANCTTHWFNQTLDHFNFHETRTFMQRYYVCGKETWGRKSSNPVFFYTGNEASVDLYVNATGLMWESAEQFSALLIFAEHRYFGKSLPFPNTNPSIIPSNLAWLSSEQALADYATLLFQVRNGALEGVGPFTKDAPIIGFGGSYGGMLASWLRLKYPAAVDGVIAGSAPILSFLGESPKYDSGSYAIIETDDATSTGGVSNMCASKIRSSWRAMFALGNSTDGISKLSNIFKLCKPLNNFNDVVSLAEWAQSSFDYMSMGSYPYPSSYMLNGFGVLPPYPLRKACDLMVNSDQLLEGLQSAISVFYNYTGANKECFDLDTIGNAATSIDSQLWDYLYCTEMVQPFSRDGIHDMFWPQPFDFESMKSSCQKKWNVSPRKYWATINYGGRKAVENSLSNVVFSNGQLDPWHGGGVLSFNSTEKAIASIVIKDVGHHIDLMFENQADPQQVKDARDFERKMISMWIKEKVVEK
eukprot:g2699.t1